MTCPFCNYHIIYDLNTGQKKCGNCKKKFSLKKLEILQKTIQIFTKNKTALEASKDLKVNYRTIQKRYETFRSLITRYLEEEYRGGETKEYNEYFYLAKSKKRTKETIFDNQNFLTFHYEEKIYNLLMPNMSRYKHQLLDDGAQEAYFKEFSKFIMFNKISKIKKRKNLITQFWEFFEENITKYKGVNNDNFVYYLKEIEFKFNYSTKEQQEILDNLTRKNLL